MPATDSSTRYEDPVRFGQIASNGPLREGSTVCHRSRHTRPQEETTNTRRPKRPPATRTRYVPRVTLTPTEAAESIGCSAEFFREHVDHELRWIRRGRKRFVPVVELERWADANAETTL